MSKRNDTFGVNHNDACMAKISPTLVIAAHSDSRFAHTPHTVGWEAVFLKGPDSPEKGFQPKPWPVLSATHIHTYWEAAFLKGPNSRKKAHKRPLVASSQKVAGCKSNSHIGKPLFVEPQILEKASKRLLQRCPERPREAHRGAERPREAQRGAERP